MVRKKTRAWIVTWEGTRDPAFPASKHVAVFKKHIGATRVKEYVELIYSLACYSLEERLRFALDPYSNPYPAKISMNEKDRQTYITCGHNPYLYARIVDNPKIEKDEEGQAKITWE